MIQPWAQRKRVAKPQAGGAAQQPGRGAQQAVRGAQSPVQWREFLEDLESRRMMSATDVALIDTSLPNFSALSHAVSEQTRVITYDGRTESANKVLGKLIAWAAATKQQIHSVSILSHGSQGKFALGKDWITDKSVQEKSWARLKNVLADDASIYVFGCNVAANDGGRNLLNHLATVSGADVYGSKNLTGKGGDWVLEVSSKNSPQQDATPLVGKSLLSWDASLAAVLVTQHSSTTTEAGGPATFDVVLDEAPTDDVTIPVASNNSAEGTTDVASLLFTPLNWMTPQTVTVTGQNDDVDDGDINYQVDIGPATSNDSAFDGQGYPALDFTNQDNDTAGITVTPTSGLTTTEAGGQATFDVYLNSEPTDDVTIAIASTNTAEGTVSTALLTFTAANWDTPQTVTITGQNDDIDDGDVAYTITTGAASSSDTNYNNLNASDVSVSNTDNDTAGFLVTPTSGLITTEGGGQATFDVVLTSEPTNDVTISITSGDLTEGTVNVASLTFTAANWDTPQTVTITGLQDFAADGNVAYTIVTGAASSSDPIYNTINPSDVSVTNNQIANVAPVNSVPGAQSTNEDTNLVFSVANSNVISISDTDAGTNAMQVTLTATNGAITLSGTTGLTFSGGDGTADASMTFTGTIANINAALAGMIFAPTGNYNGAGASLQMVTSDQGNTGAGGALSDTDTVNITVNSINDAPVNNVPAAQSTNEDTNLVFSSGNGNLISITDVDSGSSSVQVTLTASNGLLSLSGTTGLSFTTGDGTADATMTFTGTASAINTALAGMIFAPTAEYSGAASVQIQTSDLGNSGAGGTLTDNDTVNITVNAVNDNPLNSVPAAQSTNEDTALVFSSGNGNLISLSDIDAGSSSVQVTLTASNGAITLSGTTGLSFSGGDGTADATMTFSGTIANINTALAGMSFTPTGDFNGAASIQIVTSDLGNTGSGGAKTDSDTVNITVNAVNDAPSNSVPGAQNVTEDTSLTFTTANGNRITINDVDAGTIEVTITATGGTFTLVSITGLTFTVGDGTADATMTFSGNRTTINNRMNSSVFTPTADLEGAASLQIDVDDLGNTGSGGALTDTDTVAITVNPVNDAPVLSGTNNLTAINEDVTNSTGTLVSALLSGFVTDVDTSPLSGMAVTAVDNTNGAWQYTTDGGSNWNNFGSPSAVASRLLAGDANTRVRFVPNANYNGTVSGVTFRAWDQTSGTAGSTANTTSNGGTTAFSTATATASITVNAVNDGPTNTVPGSQTMSEDGTLVFSSGNGNLISIADIDAASGSVQVTLTATNGTVTLSGITGLSFSGGDGTADATMTFSGTIANINTALAGISFTPTTNYNGAGASLQISTNDQGNTGSGGSLSDTDSVSITVNAVNDAPVLSGANNLAAINEDVTNSAGTLVSDLLSGFVSDVDASALSGIAVTAVDNTNGTWQYTTDGGSNWNNFGSPSAAASRLLTDNASTRVRFVPNANYNGTVSGLTFRAWDQTSGTAGITANTSSNGGITAFSSATATASITVNPVNDGPTNSIPGAQNVNEDGTLVFSSGNGNLISIADVDSASGSIQLTLTATNGLLSLNGITGLGFSTGDGTADATMTFTGTLANVNAALAGMSFAPTANYNGSASVQIAVDDQGNSGSGGSLTDTDTVNITVNPVNDAPVLAGTANLPAIDEDDVTSTGILVSSLIAGQITDIDASPLSGIAVTAVNNTNGTWQYTTDGGSNWNNFGSPSAAASRLLTDNANTRVRFVPGTNFNGNVSGITFRAWDQTSGAAGSTANTSSNGGTTAFSSAIATASITVNAVNDDPVNNVPAAQNVNEDGTLVFSSGNGNQISITDVDAGASSVRVTLTSTNGLLTLNGTAGLSFTAGDGTADSTMTFTGTVAAINTALNGMSFSPTSNYNGAASVQIATNDLGNSGTGGVLTDTDAVAITVNAVNDGPVNTVPGAQTTAEDVALIFSTANGNRISIADLDAATGSVRITLTVTNGSLSLVGTTGLSFSVGDGTADATMTFTGTITDVNAALDGMSFTPTQNYNGAASLQITTDDQANTGSGGALSDTDSVAITITAVNDAPVNNVPGPQSVNEDATLTFSSGNGNQLSISDVDAGGSIVRVTLASTNGLMSLSGIAGLTFTVGDGSADAAMTFTGTIANINAALNGMTFSPTTNYTGAASVQITTNDLGNSGSGGSLSDVDGVSITVAQTNDAPVNSMPGAQTTVEDTPIVLSTGNGNKISISDLDENGGALEVTLTATNGSITLSGTTGLTFSTGTGTGDVLMTFSGTLADINTALDGLTFTPAADYTGSGAAIQIATNDLGNTGIGGAQSDTDSVSFTVTPVNDAPVNTMPEPQATYINLPLVFSTTNGNAISIGDVDAGGAIVRVTLTATNGRLTLSGTTGLSFTTGDGTSDTTMTFTGTMVNINNALEGMSFVPTLNFAGIGGVQITTNDQGNTGSGGAKITTDSVVVEMVTEFRVNTVTTDTQNGAIVAADEVGNFVVVWASRLQDGDGYGVYAQRYDYNGTAVGGPFRVNQQTSGDQKAPVVGMDRDGNFVIAWQSQGQDGSNWGVYARRYSANGTALGNEFVVTQTTNGAQDQPAIGVGANGSFVVAWRDDGHGNNKADTWARVFNASGTAITAEFRVNAATPNLQDQPAAAMDASGNFVIAWRNNSGGISSNVYAKRYDSSGTALGGEFQVNTITSGNQDRPTVAMSPTGEFVFAWSSDNVDGSGRGVAARLYDAAGVALGSQFLVNTYSSSDQTVPSVAMDGDANFTVLWASNGQDGSGYGIYSQKYDATGATIGGETRISSTTTNNQTQPAVAMSTIGDMVVVFEGNGPGDSSGVFGQYYQSVNSAPVNSIPAAQTINEDASLVFSSGNGNLISISDSDGGALGIEKVTLTATNGLLTLSGTTGLTFTTGDGTADATMVFTGTIANINAALAGMTFAPTANYNGAASLQITTDDQGNHGTGGALIDTDTIAITINPVNDAPVLSGTNNLMGVNEDDVSNSGNLVSDLLSGHVSEVDASPLSGIAVTAVDNTNGTWQYTTDGGSNWINFGTPSAVSARLLANNANTRVRFVPNANYNGTVSGITFRAWDQTSGAAGSTANVTSNGGTTAFSSATATASITVGAVNDAPVNTVPGGQTTNEDQSIVFSSGNGNQISVADLDVNEGTGIARLTLTATNGLLTLSGIAGLIFTTGDGTTDATMTFTGTLAAINTALNGLTFAPTPNYNGSATLQIVISDQGNTGSGGTLTDSDTINITINPVNDAPVLSGTNNLTGISEDDVTNSGNLVSALLSGHVSEVDASPLSGIAVTAVDNTNGTWQYSTDGGSNWINFGSPIGTSARLLTDTARVRFVPNSNYNGTVSGITFRAWDQTSGSAGSTADVTTNGGITAFSSASATASIVVSAVNDAPILTTPGPQTTNEDAAITFSSGNLNQISIADVDVNEGTGIARLTLTATNGLLTLSGIAGLSFVTGDGTGDATMTFTGTLAAINNALNGLVFAPTQHYNGPATLAITLSDQGNTGSGGTLTDSDTINITINPVNDAPVLSGSNNFAAINEDDVTNDGDLVSDLLAGHVSEVDAAPLAGIAVTAVDNTNGTWQYSIDGGSNWLNFGSPTAGAARLLPDDARVRFVPNSDYNGTVSPGITFRAWDQTAGAAGATADVTSNGGITAFSAATASCAITINAVNDAPILTTPPAQTTNEDASIVFSNGNGNLISIADVDVDEGTGIARVTLTATNGLLTLSGIAGLSFVTGDGTGDVTMTFTGTVAAINTALNGLTFAPTPDYNGPATLAITLSDQGNTGSGGTLTDSDTINVTINPVNDAPVLSGSNNFTAINEDEVTNDGDLVSDLLAGHVSEVDAAPLSGIAVIAVDNTNGTWQYSIDGGSNWLNFGSPTATSARLLPEDARVRFVPNANYNGTVSPGITFRAWDQTSGAAGATADVTGNGGITAFSAATASCAITINAVNDAPIISTPPDQIILEDADLVFSSGNGTLISITDFDVNEGTGLLEVTLAAAHGKLTLSGTTGLSFTAGDGTDDVNTQFTGTLADINAALNGMTFSPTANYNAGGTSVQIGVTDLGNTGSGGALTDNATVGITIDAVNDAPVLSGSNNFANIDEDNYTNNGDLVSDLLAGHVSEVDAAPLSGIAVIDVDNTNGTWQYSLNGGSSWIAFGAPTGTSARLIPATARVRFVPNLDYFGTVTAGITFRAWDQTSGTVGGTADVSSNGGITAFSAATASCDITVDSVNDAPDAIVPGLQTTTEDTPITFSVGNGNLISIFDVDAAANDLEIVLTVTHGTLSLSGIAGLTFTTGDGMGDTTMTFRGTVGSINAALAGMVYSPDSNYKGAAKLTISVDDLGHNGSGGAHSNTREVNLDVGSINDAPIITAPASQTINEDNNLVFSSGGSNAISIFDVDADPDQLEITVTATHGKLTLSGITGLSFTTGDGAGDTTMTFRGTQAAINAALQGMTFAPDAHYNGNAAIQLDVSDLGHNGSGGVLTDSHTVNLTINAVNDAPILITPTNQATDEDNSITFSGGNGNQISIADVDVDEGTGQLSVTLTAANGLLTLSGINGLSFVTGDGTADAAMTFTGTLTDINAALNGMVFSPNLNYNGPASVQVDLSDQGNTGIGGTLTDSDTIGIDVNAVNDAPTHSVPPAQTIDEDTPLVFSSGNGNAVTIGDVDAATVRVTLTVTNGRLTLSGIAGLTFITGDGTADTAMTFVGSVSDINAALEGMSYLGDLHFNGAASLSITTNDQGSVGSGGAKSASNTIGITVEAVNDAPVNTLPGQQTFDEDTDLVFSIGNGNSITISDVDVNEGTGIVQVTLTATHGTLTLGDTTNVGFTVGDGVDDVTMTITGTLTRINQALNGLTFHPDHDYFGPATVQITTNDKGNNGKGGSQTAADTIDIDVNPVNDAPVINTTNSPVQYTENDGAVVIDSSFDALDVDDANLEGAAVAILNYVAGEDVLSFVDQNGIAGTWDAQTGVLTLSGSATVAHYQAALRSVTYTNTSDNPNTATRAIRFTVTDGALASNPADRAIEITSVNDNPTATPNVTVTLTEDAGRSTVDLWTLFNDIEDPDGDLQLSLITSNHSLFSGVHIDPATGRLVLDSAHDAFGTATLVVRATDKGGLTVDQEIHIVVDPVNDAPVATLTPGGIQFDPDEATFIDPTISLGDVDSDTLTGAVVKIANVFPLEDVLTFTEAHGITGHYDATTGTLTLTGTATVAQYEEVLRTVAYVPAEGSTPSYITRQIEITVNDGVANSLVITQGMRFPLPSEQLPPPPPRLRHRSRV